MFIHFAFGSLAKEININAQTKNVIEHILKCKRLKVSKCKEFIPRFPEPGAKIIPKEMFKVTDNGLVATFHPQEDPNWLKDLPDDTTIHYMPMDVPMICFIKIHLSQLKTSTHSNEYGKFGIVLTDNFLKSKNIKPVYYYTETSLYTDPLIVRWNTSAESLSLRERKEIENEILPYRKPATLFPSFKESVITKISGPPGEIKVEHLTYDRYEEGYDFSKENEYRIVFNENIEYLDFSEKDIFMIITPESKSKEEIDNFINSCWSHKPSVMIYPTC